MKRIIYIIILLMSAIWLSSCKASRNMETEKQVDYSGEFQYQRNMIESLKMDVNRQTKITTERLSDLKIENTTVYLSAPDSTGKQYPVKESTTTALSITLQQFSNRLDSLNGKVNAILSQRKKIIELSWWDLHKNKVYLVIALMIVVIWVVYGRNK